MMYSSVLLCVTSVLVVGTFSASIPPGTKGCKRDDPKLNECVVKTANEIIPTIAGGNEEYGIPSLDPFLVTSIVVSEKSSQSVDLELKLEDAKFRGGKKFRMLEGSKFNLKDRKFHFELMYPTMNIQGKYKMDGKILLVPIKGDGDLNFTFTDLKVVMDTDFVLQKGKNGKDYLQMVNTKLNFTTEKTQLSLSNLFNGNNALGDQMNALLNDNWKEVLTELGPPFRETLKKILLSIWNNVALRVPYDVLFPE